MAVPKTLTPLHTKKALHCAGSGVSNLSVHVGSGGIMGVSAQMRLKASHTWFSGQGSKAVGTYSPESSREQK